MPAFPTANFSDSDQGLFTPEEIRRLMRIEFERAVRYGYPIVCALIEVDRLESLHDLYGYESKEEILNAVIGLLRSMTRASDFLGCMRDDRLMVMFPHTHRSVAARLSDRMLRGARKLRFDSDGRTLRTTLSIGISYAEPGERLGYEEFVLAAEEALQLAVAGGGDRSIERGETLRQELNELRDDVEAEAIALQETRAAPGPAPLGSDPGHDDDPTVPVSVAGLPETPLGEKIRALFELMGPQGVDTARLQQEIVDLALAALNASEDVGIAEQLEERNRQVELLERRVKKLAGLLDITEAELRRVAELQSADPGIASIYRSVQGLSTHEREYELKKLLMAAIFRANLELKKQMEGRKA